MQLHLVDLKLKLPHGLSHISLHTPIQRKEDWVVLNRVVDLLWKLAIDVLVQGTKAFLQKALVMRVVNKWLVDSVVIHRVVLGNEVSQGVESCLRDQEYTHVFEFLLCKRGNRVQK